LQQARLTVLVQVLAAEPTVPLLLLGLLGQQWQATLLLMGLYQELQGVLMQEAVVKVTTE